MASSDNENDDLVPISSTALGGTNDDVVPRFTINNETNRQYRRFNAVGTELIVRLLPPAVGDDSDAITHFLPRVNYQFEYALRNVYDSDMVGITIRNEFNFLDKPIGISFRRKDQLSDLVMWSVFNKVAQSNAWYNAIDRLIFAIRSVGFGKTAVKSKVRPLSVMAHVKQHYKRQS